MKKICSECNTENELHYLYCKNCGNPLEGEEPAPIQPEPVKNTEVQEEKSNLAPWNPYGVPVKRSVMPKVDYNLGFEPNSVAGIEKSDFTTFIGKNGDKIYSKFAKMEYSGSKVSWCWPAAVLQFFLGFLGSAIWFFYRKMYKIAVILMALGIVFTVATTILTYDTQVSVGEQILSSFSEIIDELESGDIELQSNVVEDIENAPDETADLIKSGIAELLGIIESFGGVAIIGMFAMHFYKKHCIKKITAYKSKEVDSRYYSYCLGLVGGTSGGMLALGIIIAVLVSSVIEGIFMLPLLSTLGG